MPKTQLLFPMIGDATLQAVLALPPGGPAPRGGGSSLRGEAGNEPQHEDRGCSNGKRPRMAHGWLPESERQAQNEKHVDRPGKVRVEKMECPAILRSRPKQRYLPVRADIKYDVKQPTAEREGVAGAPTGKLEREQRKD